MMNLLAIDAGNTRIKWGLHDGHMWLQRGYVTHDELPALATIGSRIDHVIISNVAGTTVAHAIAGLFPAHIIHFLKASREQCGVSNHYADPAQLGSDRWAALIAAYRLGAGTALVVTAGTAITVDALHAGQFLGGAIAPGLQLMRSALTRGTAQLNIASGKYTDFPHNTSDAIATGCLLALSGVVQQMAMHLLQHSQQAVTVWINGGDAELLIPHLSLPVRLEDNLVLTGLHIIAQEVFA